MLPPARMLVIQKWCVRFRRRASQFLGRVLASLQDADERDCEPGVSRTRPPANFWNPFGVFGGFQTCRRPDERTTMKFATPCRFGNRRYSPDYIGRNLRYEYSRPKKILPCVL